MKVEIGGGVFPRGEGFINVDMLDCADVVHDLNEYPYPFGDASVDAVYSSHCLEHLNNPMDVLREIARICKVGAMVEVRVPAMGSPCMWTHEHKHCLTALLVIDADGVFADQHWPKGQHRLRLKNHYLQSSWHLEEFKRDCPRVAALFGDDQQIMKYIPITAHETVFHFTVEQT